MKTIAKNRTAKINELFANAQNVTVYSLETYFAGQPASAEWVRKQLDTFSFAKLQDMGGGSYKVRVTGREWYEFTA